MNLVQQGLKSGPVPPSFQVLGIRVDAVQMPVVLALLRSWIDTDESRVRYVAVTAMHGVAEARENEAFRETVNAADLVVPDGMPLIWFARLRGHALQRRVCGSEVMESFCRETGNAYRHFFYGGMPGVAENLAQVLHEKHGIVVAGTYCPPFRTLNEIEERELVSLVEEAAPDVLWVGLNSPKQENFMYAFRDRLKVRVMLGVGAAFDMNSGRSRRAPRWMRDWGLEWLYRLFSEPRRLGRRYLVTIPKAMWFAGLELFGATDVVVRTPGKTTPEFRV